VKVLFKFLLLAGLPAAVFIGSYALTERYFRWMLVPLPFEHAGIAVGLGFFFWTLAILVLILEKKKGEFR
jgi:hypothetical protein